MNSPLSNSYWVVPGRLLAGEHPYGIDAADARNRLSVLHTTGINFFIDLTEPHEMPEYRQLLRAGTKYVRSPIADVEAPRDVAQMRDIQKRIRAALIFGRCVYIHCRAGIGRTGTVAGCYLAETGLDGKAALKQLNLLWRQSARSKSWPKVPQTQTQANYILDWPRHRTKPGIPGAVVRRSLR